MANFQQPAPTAYDMESVSEKAQPSISPATHVVGVNVLGLAGITVDRTKYILKHIGRNETYPPPPNEMKAIVAISRGQIIKGTTTLSKPLSESLTEDVVVESYKGGNNQKVETAQRKQTNYNAPQRHVAVWSMDSTSLGSMVTFEANLRRMDNGQAKLASSQYIPKSFDLTVALTDTSNSEKKVALPVGVATLNISGDEWKKGGTLVVDLPILSLQQAKPLAPNKNGLGGFQMIAINSKDDPVTPSKKRNVLQRIFGRGRDTKQTHIPSVIERKVFSSVYSTDSCGDAILRIQLQVVEKGSSRKFQNTDYVSYTDRSSLKSYEDTVETERKDTTDTASTKSNSTESAQLSKNSLGLDSLDSNTLQSDDDNAVFSFSAVMRDQNEIFDEDSATILSKTLLESRSPRDVEHTTNNGGIDDKNKKIYSAPVEETGEDDYTLRFIETSKGTDDTGDDPIIDIAVVNVFGKEIRIPSCGPLAMVETNDGPKAKFFDDDITHLTGDFFGRDFAIPVCSTLKEWEMAKDDDLTLRFDDSFSTVTDERSLDESRKNFRISRYLRARMQHEGFQETDFILPQSAEDESMTNTLEGTLEETSLQESPKPEKNADGQVPPKLIRPVKSKGSPRGVADLKNKERSMADSIAGMFRCGSSTVDDQSYMSKVPELVVPNDLDSLGDLTLTTYERKCRLPKQKKSPLPVALGGSGLCSNLHLVEDSSQVMHSGSGPSSRENRVKDDYFSDYNDDYSFLKPRSRDSNKVQHPPRLGQRALL